MSQTAHVYSWPHTLTDWAVIQAMERAGCPECVRDQPALQAALASLLSAAVRLKTVFDRQGQIESILATATESACEDAGGSAYVTLREASAAATRQSLASHSRAYVRVEPAKTYTLNATASSITNGEINIVAPPGYRVVMDNMLRTRETFSGSATVIFQLLPSSARHPGLAGMASSISSLEVEWRVSLGSLLNGGSAGDLALIDTGARSDWSAIFTPASLYYETASDEISVYRPNNTISQIIANQVVVDVVVLNSTSYEIRCYHPSQMQSGSNPRTFTGSAFVTYRVQQGTTSTSVKITKEVRNVTDATTTFSIARSEITSLARTGTWPVITWTKSDWTLSGQTALSETYVSSTGTTSARTETIAVRVPGNSTPVVSLTRNYTVPQFSNQSTIGEVLTSETVGTTNSLSASFDYYKDPGAFGSLGFVKSATLPGGSWVAYDYWDANPATGETIGRVANRYRPYLNSPSTITQSYTQGEVTSYSYVMDVFGAQTRPWLVETKVNGTTISKSTTAYTDNAATVNGYPITTVTHYGFNDATHALVTTTNYFPENTGNAFIRGQTHSTTSPEYVKKSFAYQHGNWDGSSFTLTGGTASRISVITGTSLSGSGTAYSALGSYHDTGFNEYNNYLDQRSVTITVTKANQTITFPTIATHTYGDAPFALSATASSGLSITYTVVSGPATVSGSTLTLTAGGTVTVSAAQAGNASYNAATSVNQTFNVNGPPGFATQPSSQTVVIGSGSTPNGSTTFTVVATGYPAPTYQWQRKPAGQSTFANLSNDSVSSGVTGASLTITPSTIDMSGDQFRCVLTNSLGTATSNAATMTVQSGDTTSPSVPVGLQAGAGAAGVFTLSWTPSTDNMWIVRYEVFRNGTSLGTVTGASKAIDYSGWNTPTSSSLTVRACDEANNWSAQSTALVLNIYVTPAPVDTTAPSVPTNLNYAEKTATTATLIWRAATDNVGVAAYAVYRGGTLIGSTSDLVFADGNLTANTAYSYTVKALDGAGNYSAASSALSVTTTQDFSADTDHDGIPDATETALGTSTSTAANADTTNQTQQNIHRPKP